MVFIKISVISNQSPQVATVMRSIYLQEGSTRYFRLKTMQVISNLNSGVIDYCVKHVTTQLKQNDSVY